jgi:hypothetical protein
VLTPIAVAADTARYFLPPGNFGGVPFTANSTDQLPLYSGLTPLRVNITPADIQTLRDKARELKFDLVLTPAEASSEEFARIAEM